MIINSIAVRWLGAFAFTVCPIIFIDPDLHGRDRENMLKHEWVHWWQQFWFGIVGGVVGICVWLVLSWPLQPMSIVVFALGAVEGWVAGQLLWRWLYLIGLPFGLPVFWNPWRSRWETAAYRADGFSDDEIKRILSEAPYHLRD